MIVNEAKKTTKKDLSAAKNDDLPSSPRQKQQVCLPRPSSIIHGSPPIMRIDVGQCDETPLLLLLRRTRLRILGSMLLMMEIYDDSNTVEHEYHRRRIKLTLLFCMKFRVELERFSFSGKPGPSRLKELR
jgi:hypothetical protein